MTWIMARAGERRRGGRGMRLAGSVGLVGVLLAGCGGPSKIDSAAIVGNTSIPLGDVQHEISRLVAEKPAAKQLLRRHKLDTAARSVVTTRVQHQLVDRVAGREGLRVDRATVRKQLAQPGLDEFLHNQVFDREGYARYVADRTRLAALARKQAPGLRVRMDIVAVDDPARAKQLAARVAAHPRQTARMMRQANPQAGIDQTLRPLQDVQTASSTPLFGTGPGTVVAFPAGEQSAEWYVARILDREQGAPQRGAQQALSQIGPSGLAMLGQQLLIPAAQRIGVRLNPRYGSWDPYTLSAVAGEGQRQVTAYRVGGTGA